jgi:hypothetical protein
VEVPEEHVGRSIGMLVESAGDVYQRNYGTVPEDLIEVQVPELT